MKNRNVTPVSDPPKGLVGVTSIGGGSSLRYNIDMILTSSSTTMSRSYLYYIVGFKIDRFTFWPLGDLRGSPTMVGDQNISTPLCSIEISPSPFAFRQKKPILNNQ
jgi:hypothetical protein